MKQGMQLFCLYKGKVRMVQINLYHPGAPAEPDISKDGLAKKKLSHALPALLQGIWLNVEYIIKIKVDYH